MLQQKNNTFISPACLPATAHEEKFASPCLTKKRKIPFRKMQAQIGMGTVGVFGLFVFF